VDTRGVRLRVISGSPKARPRRRTGHVRDEIRAFSFDYLVGAHQQRSRNGDPKGLRDLEIDGQLDLGGPLHRQVPRLLSFQNPTYIGADDKVFLGAVSSIA